MPDVDYEKLWEMLEKNNMQKTDHYKKVVKICKYFNCIFDDIVGIVD